MEISHPLKRIKRDPATFHDLPDEIVYKILNLLDYSSLKTASLINKRCASIVATSSVLMKNFKLKLSGDFWQTQWKILEVLSLERRVQVIEISVVGCHNVLTNIFKRFGSDLKSLTISDSKIDDFTLREVLRSSETLESLTLSEVSVVKMLPAVNPVGMRKLKSLTINHCDWSIFKFLTAQIKSLDLKSYLDEGSRVNLVNFLTQQRNLRELTLRGTSSRALFTQDDVINQCNFNLTKFQVEHVMGKNSDNVNWHLTTFLSLHVETLKNVEISGPNCEAINGFVIANLENLEKLTIDVRGLPKDEEFYEFVEREPNEKLKELSLKGFFVNQQAIKRILKKFPAIEKLDLNDWGTGADLLDFVSKNFPKLQQLSVTEISSGENAKFEALNKLTVTYIRNTGKLLQFITSNSSVDTVKVGLIYMGQITKSFINNLKDLENVKHLSFSGNSKALTSILELMKKNEPPESLKTLELSLAADAKFATTSGKAAKFYFPIAKTTKFEMF